jgi:hypothetical protein
MVSMKRCFVVMAMGVTLLVGLTHCVIAPAAPAPAGYVVAPPVVVIRPYRPYHPYHPYRAYRPHHGWYPHSYRW